MAMTTDNTNNNNVNEYYIRLIDAELIVTFINNNEIYECKITKEDEFVKNYMDENISNLHP